MNKEKKLYLNLLNLDMEKGKVLEVVEKFYSEWGQFEKKEEPKVSVKQEILKYLRSQTEMVHSFNLISTIVDAEKPLCSPFDYEEAIKELELKGEIYQPKHHYWKATRGLNK